MTSNGENMKCRTDWFYLYSQTIPTTNFPNHSTIYVFFHIIPLFLRGKRSSEVVTAHCCQVSPENEGAISLVQCCWKWTLSLVTVPTIKTEEISQVKFCIIFWKERKRPSDAKGVIGKLGHFPFIQNFRFEISEIFRRSRNEGLAFWTITVSSVDQNLNVMG